MIDLLVSPSPIVDGLVHVRLSLRRSTRSERARRVTERATERVLLAVGRVRLAARARLGHHRARLGVAAIAEVRVPPAVPRGHAAAEAALVLDIVAAVHGTARVGRAGRGGAPPAHLLARVVRLVALLQVNGARGEPAKVGQLAGVALVVHVPPQRKLDRLAVEVAPRVDDLGRLVEAVVVEPLERARAEHLLVLGVRPELHLELAVRNVHLAERAARVLKVDRAPRPALPQPLAQAVRVEEVRAAQAQARSGRERLRPADRAHVLRRLRVRAGSRHALRL
mmetsp:Transcript_1983/g.5287  ORF Transcript_1983/g.5287 Transcript_1983/m.5287 type:complete len:281 (+) Transcript_1983:42-884(+)